MHLLHLSYCSRCRAVACLEESTCSSDCIVCTVKVLEAEAVGSHFCACDEMAMHGLLGVEEEAHGSLIPHLDPLSTANIWNVNPFDNVSRPQKADSALQADSHCWILEALSFLFPNFLSLPCLLIPLCNCVGPDYQQKAGSRSSRPQMAAQPSVAHSEAGNRGFNKPQQDIYLRIPWWYINGPMLRT